MLCCTEVHAPSLRSGRFYLAGLIPLAMFAQDPSDSSGTLAAPSTSEKWEYFTNETIAPLTLAAGAFNATVSQLTRSAPLYGRHPWPVAYPERFGASVGDIVSQNIWGDFVLASAFHEDTRYRRKGESHKLWSRIGYAVSRSLVTRRDAGGSTFNFANVLGTAMSAGLSNAYYPRGSQKVGTAATNWGTSIAGSGLANLTPEFLPDFKRWLKRHHL
jgi:hypothetical protein